MTAFVDSCLDTLTDSAKRVQRNTHPHARKLLKALAGKTNILITTHIHPDPDAAASCAAMRELLSAVLPNAKVSIRFKGQHDAPRFAGFVRTAQIQFQPWDDAAIEQYDAIVLLDTQPTFSVSPLPPGVEPTIIVDHHRGRNRKSKSKFNDTRIDVGATASIVFSYFMELKIPIDPTLAAALLHAIESDTAGAAGTQSELDTVAISSLVLTADIRKLWQMRYVEVPAGYYAAFARAVNSAIRYDSCLIAQAGRIQQVEEAALIADGLLRCEGTQVVLVTAEYDGRIILSLRTAIAKSAGELMRRLVNRIGDGGGHRNKAGGQITPESPTNTCTDRIHVVLKRRLLRSLHIGNTRGVRLA